MWKNFMLFKPGWWVVHILAILAMFYLGHKVDF